MRVISSREQAPRHEGARLLVDGEDNTLFRRAQFALSPTTKQAAALQRLLAVSCEAYNAALQERRDAYRHPSRTKVKLFDQFNQLGGLSAARPDLLEFGTQPIRSALTRLDEAYQGFFRRAQQGQKAGFPRFRSQRRYDTACWDVPTSWRLTLEPAGRQKSEKRNTLYLQGIGTIRLSRSAVKQLQRLVSRGGVAVTLRISRQPSGRSWKWRACIAFKHVAARKTQPTAGPGSIVGLDRGTVVPLATSGGELLVMPPWHREAEESLKALQRAQAAKVRGSRAWVQLGRKIKRMRAKLAHRTENWARHQARDLVARYEVIAFEDLRLQNMTRSARGTIEEPGKNVRQKAGLNRALSEVALGKLAKAVHVRAEEAGRRTWLVNPAYTSQECAECGHTSAENRPTRDAFSCTSCGHEAHADVNAARVIRSRGVAAEAAWAAAGSPLLERPRPRLHRDRKAVLPAPA